MPGAYSTENILREAIEWPAEEQGEVVFEPMFPLRNIADDRPGRVARQRFGAQAFRFDVVLAQPRDVELIALINHNLTGTMDVILAPSRHEWASGVQIQIELRPGEATWVTFPMVSLMRYLSFSQPAGSVTTDGQAAQVGLVWAGRLRVFPTAVQWGAQEGRDQLIHYAETEYGAPVTFPLAERAVWEGRFPDGLTYDEVLEVADLHRTLRGRARPFLFVPDLEYPEVILGRLGEDEWRDRMLAPGVMEGPVLTVLEDPWGLTGV